MHSNLIALKDRLLLFNGISIVEPEDVPDLFLKGLKPSQIQVAENSFEIEEFNKRSDEPLKIFDVDCNIDLTESKRWLLPDEYLNLDLDEYFHNFLIQLPENIQERAEVRINNELAEVKTRHFEDGLRTIIFVVDTFKKNKQVWGVGRGSSCASYLLYLIGLHKVDCLKYDVSYHEFFHD